MKKSSLQTHSSKLLFACAALGLALTSKTASAQTLTLISNTVNDGGFESVGMNKVFFVSPTSSTANIPYWGATLVSTAGAAVAAPTDSGSEQFAVSTGNDISATHSGIAGGFWQPGGNSTAFNLVTTRPMALGDVYNLTWYGRFTGNGGAQAATLFSQLASTVGATYTYQPIATLTSLDQTNADNFVVNTFSQFSLTYTATAADVGNDIGLTYGNSGTAYIAADDFFLTVTPAAAAPEPSTYALLLAGLGGVSFVRRFRRDSV